MHVPKEGLQRTLDIYWVMHNFVRKHFTTKEVPAVKIGILNAALSGLDHIFTHLVVMASTAKPSRQGLISTMLLDRHGTSVPRDDKWVER